MLDEGCVLGGGEAGFERRGELFTLSFPIGLYVQPQTRKGHGTENAIIARLDLAISSFLMHAPGDPSRKDFDRDVFTDLGAFIQPELGTEVDISARQRDLHDQLRGTGNKFSFDTRLPAKLGKDSKILVGLRCAAEH